MKQLIIILGLAFISQKAISQIQGTIKDMKGIKINNAIVSVKDSLTGKIDTARMEKKGFYIFYNLKPGNYVLKATAPAYVPVAIHDIIITPDDRGATREEPDLYSGIRLNIEMQSSKK